MGKRAMLALIGIGMVSLMGCNGESMLEPEQATADGREVVVVDGASPVVLDVRNGVGTITLRGAESEDAHEIAVAYTLTAYAATKAQAEREVAAMTVTVTQEDGRVQVNAVQTQFRDHPRTNKVDLTISVPPSIDLVLRNAVGDVDVRGVQAPRRLDIAADVGDIVLNDVVAAPLTRVAGEVGNVTFEGALAATGSASLTTDVGKVIVRLPQDTAAAVEAQTAGGRRDHAARAGREPAQAVRESARRDADRDARRRRPRAEAGRQRRGYHARQAVNARREDPRGAAGYTGRPVFAFVGISSVSFAAGAGQARYRAR